jgi:sugar phosphate isomerase/epimerase
MKLGIFTMWIQAQSIEELAEKVKQHQLECVILDAYPGLDIDLDNPSKAHTTRIRRAFEDQGISIAAVGGYSNLVHPDPMKRKAVHQRFKGLMKLAHEVGSPMLCSETGTYHPLSDWHWDPANATEQAFQELVGTVKGLLQEAASYDVTLGFEPYVMNIAYTPDRARRFIEALQSPLAKIVIDPAGVLTRATLHHQAEVLQEMFTHLSTHIGLVHVEDCTTNPEDHLNFHGAGQGVIDYPLFMKHIVASNYRGPLILEHLQEHQIAASRQYVIDHLHEALSKAGEARHD